MQEVKGNFREYRKGLFKKQELLSGKNENPKKLYCLTDLGVDEKIILKYILNKIWGVDLIALAQNKVQWHDLLNMVINLKNPQTTPKFLYSWATISSQEHCSTKFVTTLKVQKHVTA
jgi:hypothetical protein